MSAAVLKDAHYHDEQAAYDFVEARVWADGRVCPHCGVVGKSGKLEGKSTRIGVYKCYACRKPFTVKIGTIFESSHVKLHLWLQAMFLMCSSKKGISSNQLHRILGVTLKTAWFMSHRIREAMGLPAKAEKLGGGGKVVEIDETYLFTDPDKLKVQGKKGYSHKMAVVSLVERGGRARSFYVPDAVTKADTVKILFDNVPADTSIMTDESGLYKFVSRYYQHDTVNHNRGEYVRGEVYTNTVEGYFSVFKRGMRGVYQHCDKKHLQRYLNEFDFRYSNRVKLGVNDEERTSRVVRGIVGKRLTYRPANRPV